VAAELKKSHSAEVELVEGSGGIFQVFADDRLVYDKADTGRFPNIGETSALIDGA
jgi:predicted Rdx family selenoprotein